LALIPQAVFSTASFSGQYLRFERLVPELGGMPVAGISSVLQDKQGFLWFGTSAGLARYDGYSFAFYPPESSHDEFSSSLTVYPIFEDSAGDIWVGTHGEGLLRFDKTAETFVQYRRGSQQAGRLSGDIVLAIQEDRKGNLWIGTRLNGLNRFERGTGSFVRFSLDPEVEGIWDLLVDRQGFLWVGTQDGGLFKVDPETGEAINYRFILDNPRSLGSNTVWSIFEDSAGRIWVGTNGGGLNEYVAEEDCFLRFYGDGDHPRDLSGSTIAAIAEDVAGRLWIGTTWNGLRIWDRETGEYVIYKHDPQDPESLSDDNIAAIARDACGIMWVGTARGGISKCLADQVKFHHFKRNPYNPRSLSRSDVGALLVDRSGRLWVGLNEGLDRIDGRTGVVTRFGSRSPENIGLNTGGIQAILEDRAARIWLGTDNGLLRLDPRTGAFLRHLKDPAGLNGLSNNKIYALCEDRSEPGVLWIGTHAGLNRFDTRRSRWTRFVYDPSDASSLSGNIIRAILEDRAGGLWVGTSHGLNRMDKATGRCVRYVHNIRDRAGTGIINNIVHWILEDRKGVLWVGTEGGMSRFDSRKGEWTSFSQDEGLPGSLVGGILEDERGFLWISTNHGLSRFDPGSGLFTNFGVFDGIQGLVFNPGACFKAPDGKMFFGGVNGFNSFDPAAVGKNSCIPPVVWAGLSRYGRNLKAGRPFGSAGGLKIPYKFGFVTMEFAALCFVHPARNRFAYRLEPRDREWIDLGFDHSVSLSSLDPGTYVLRVKGANPDGVWNEEGLEIPIEIIPPFWRTAWFFGIVAVFLTSGLILAVRTLRKIRSASSVVGDSLEELTGKYPLTAREQEILHLVLQGASNKDIGKKLFISASTVRNHIYNIYQKLGVSNRLELINMISKDARKKDLKS
jgi:ligand-binding sensor domain-containing protein/DNA-binding CsgD family transcriptional regulator